MSPRPARPVVRVLVGAAVTAVLAGLATTPATTGVAAAPVLPDPDGTVTRAAHLVALPHGPATCKQGFVWRVAAPDDLVCVTPATRRATANENAMAGRRREPGGGAYGPDTCRSGFVWRSAFPADLVCVTPDRRAQALADNAQAAARRAVDPATVPEAQRPGRYTVVLEVGSALGGRSRKHYAPTCVPGPSDTDPFHVGWSQIEIYGDPCTADVGDTAVRFDERPLDRVPVKTIERAVLTYDETAAQRCTYEGVIGSTCWRSGSGAPEPKPNGCVAVLGFPTVDWVGRAPGGLIPHTTFPQVVRTNPREWDVSTPYRWQYTRSAPLGGAPPPRFGFLLSGGVTLDRLQAEDNTSCLSAVSDVRLHVTYTVPADDGRGFVPPR